MILIFVTLEDGGTEPCEGPLPSPPLPSPPPLYVTLLSGDMTAHGKKGLTGFVFIYQDPDDGDRDRLKITRSISLAEDLHKKEEQVRMGKLCE